MSNSIILKRYNKIVVEKVAGEAFRPGMLLYIASTGKVHKHNVAGGNVFGFVALEDELQGKDIKDAYAAGDRAQVWIPQRGDEALLLLEDGQNVVQGDALESNGLGMVRKHTVETLASADSQVANLIYSRPIIGIALEDQDLSALDGSNSSLESNSQFIRVGIV
jgi:hypothetical protein